MTDLKARVGNWRFKWKGVPHGRQGVVQVGISASEGGGEEMLLDVQWKRDADGIWLVLPHGVFGFDLHATTEEDGQISYSSTQRISSQEWGAVVPSSGMELSQVASPSLVRKMNRVRAQMPGKIIKILIQPGQLVEKDQPLMVMEAMKMENEIRSLHLGTITQVKVVEGQAVETGADLAIISQIYEPEF